MKVSRRLQLVAAGLVLAACGPTWDPDREGVPRLSRRLPVDITAIAQISRFRSGAGHDFSDAVEKCRSMKHYFWYTGGAPGAPHTPSWTTIEVRAPAAGRIVRVASERMAGSQIYLQATENPAFTYRLFHVTPQPGLAGRMVEVGDLLGHNASDETYTDVAVEVARGLAGTRFVSFADTLTDEAFAPLQTRGVPTRAALVISRDERDASPLTCDGEKFTAPSGQTRPDDWVVLR